MTAVRDKVLVLGASGMVGKAMSSQARDARYDVVTAARAGCDCAVDVQSETALQNLLERVRPRVVINAAALVSLTGCENDPGKAWRVNARPAALLADVSRSLGFKLVHISTDHYYTGDGYRPHAEDAPVTLVNEYARTKYAAEALALTNPDTLIIRTNVTGFRGWPGRPTFAEWAIEAILNRAPLTLFDDFYTSTIDAATLARTTFKLIENQVCGVLNVASREVSSKVHFVTALAAAFGCRLDWHAVGSVRSLVPLRAESLGLDTSRTEALLGESLPGLEEVCSALAAERKTE